MDIAAGTGAPVSAPLAATALSAAATLASVWFTAYPAAIVTLPGESVLATLGDEALSAAYPHEVGGRRLVTGDFLTHLVVHLAYHLGQLDAQEIAFLDEILYRLRVRYVQKRG